MSKSRSLSQILNQARSFARNRTTQETSLLYLLKELESQRSVWSDDYSSWVAFLDTEQLTTNSRYRGFTVAASVFTRKAMEQYGVSACILMAAEPKRIRTRVLAEAKVWYDEYQIPLKGERIVTIIQKVDPSRKTEVKTGARHLRAHIKRLEATLANLGVKPPSVSKVDAVSAASEFIRARQVFQGLVGGGKSDAALVATAMRKASITGGKKAKKTKAA